jgi:microcystin degradation protein MlrC
MAATADIMLACKEYPHTDWPAEAGHLIDLLAKMARGEITPRTAVAYIPMLDLFPTTQEPMISLVREIRQKEREPGILSVSLTHGFPIADCKHTGAAAIVISDGDAAKADRMADELARQFFALRGKQQEKGLSIDEAIDHVVKAGTYPIVVADMSDSDGGAAPGDSTFFLRRLLERKVDGAGLSMIWDPQAVVFASQVGIGGSLPLRIGGKVSQSSGQPLDVKAKVIGVRDNARQNGLGATFHFGPAVAIAVDGVDIILSSVRQQTLSPECFTELGIDPAKKRMLVVKSRQHFYEKFKPIAAEVLYAGRFRTLKERLLETPFEHLQQPIWPFDDPPFMARGRLWT